MKLCSRQIELAIGTVLLSSLQARSSQIRKTVFLLIFGAGKNILARLQDIAISSIKVAQPEPYGDMLAQTPIISKSIETSIIR